ncbi:thioredoxin domain-containing protein [Streptomyces sp. NBC_01294]|uniref:thioredoxin domain-containing protein n=1 Tax=Streptomyces sp. NBC_01294 TaxID=2903815 RepID=UPI002DD8C62C|nr:thioredoxin domain-containing protein [Streptomyces sp. NBC_01294]WRZ55770.1 DsbA family protein [Streptomyces sp. NBC_01294]
MTASAHAAHLAQLNVATLRHPFDDPRVAPFVVVGDPAAATTVRLYEDPRCPVVEEFEATGAPALREMTLRREAKTEYTLASFRDDRVGGDGSKRAVNALRAALDAGKFTEYHAVLFENMAENELAGGYTTASLLELADQVEGLRSDTFDSAVATMKHKDFVTASEKTYEAAGGDDPRGPGTPTVAINGTQIKGGLYDWLFEKETFHLLLNSADN